MNRLKKLRQEKKLTQQELADIAEVSKRTYIYWENDESQIKPDKAQVLADHFGVSVGYLLGYSEKQDLQRKIAELKAPYLDEMLAMAHTGNPLQRRYTASDIVEVLERLEEIGV